MVPNRLILNSLYLWLLLLTYIPAQGQTIKWQEHPDKTFVFEINNREAEKLIKSDPKDSLIVKMLHKPIASFTEKWEEQPKQGHFIFANINKNKVYYRYMPVMPFQVFLFKEYGVLTIQVIDAEGTIRKDAKVKIKGKWNLFDTGVSFDKESKTYTIDDWSEKKNRILTVELDKFKAIFNLNKHLVNPWYGGRNYPGDSPEFYSYMITDKNKYKPNETIRFKSYALSENKRPLKQDLSVWMRTDASYYNYKKITTLSPYNPGGFAGDIYLHDSLKLKLDRTYSIQLRDKQSRVVASTQFHYEDYELYDGKLEVKLKEETQYYPDTNQIEIKATDANGLMLQDVKANVLIKRVSVSKAYTDILVLPDTLMFERINLDNTEPTTVHIPASLFGKSDCTYEVQVEILTYDNQPLIHKNIVSYYYDHHSLDYTSRNDTLRFEFKELGKEKRVKARLSYNNSKEEKDIELPYEEPFNQAIQRYNFKIDDLPYQGSIFAHEIESKLDLKGGINVDSFNIKLVNPLALEVSWYIYQGNLLLEKGSGKEFDFSYPNTNLEVTHYVELFYFMGDKEQVFRRTFVPKTEYLSIDMNLPERTYPGQKLDATITVTNYLGRPVRNVDLTAFAVNSLLEYNVPDLPYYGTAPRTREQRSSYSINKKDYSFSSPLNYQFWNKIAELDQLDYYRFTYPRNNMFSYQTDTPDSTTQFAPFVMKDGCAVNIYVIERNSEPVYFSWTDQLKSYSFPASDTKKQEITLRLHDRALILDSILFEKGKKTILSIDLDQLPSNVKVVRIPARDKYKRPVFTNHEIKVYSSYISRLPLRVGDYSYLKQGKTIYPLFHTCLMQRKASVLAGPIPIGQTKYMYNIEYKHEGGFSYQFDENVVYKYPEQVCPEYLSFSSNNNFNQLNQFYLTPEVMEKMINNCQTETQQWYPRSIYISQHSMNMNFRLPVEIDSTGVSNLLFRSHSTNRMLFPDRFENRTRMYSEIPQATYDVILLYNNGKYIRYDSIPLKKNAYTEVNMAGLRLHEADSLSLKWLALRTYSGIIGTRYPSPEHNTTLYSRPLIKRSIGNIVTGFIFDNTGEPLIGVTVHIKGTRYGTISNLDGYFEIDMSNTDNTLVFSYIGFRTKEINVEPGSEVSIKLDEDEMRLDEVVVVGYGVSKKSNLTGAMAGISVEGPAPQSPPEKLEDTEKEKTTEEAEDKLYNELMQLNGLRSNFSDVGFWQPALTTDKKGKARFSVTFPDNITKWDAIVYAMNRKLKTGTLRKSIRSYKPLMAELRTPQFLVAGDSSYFAGNIRNYTKDKEINGDILFTLEHDTLINKNIGFASSHQDKTLVSVNATDSITASYLFTRDDGYMDGEKRKIPIELPGTEIADGTLSFLRNGDQLKLSAGEGENIHIGITGNQLDIYADATSYLTGYKYACNEQLASKLIGLLNYKIYQQYSGKAFTHDKNINQIIRRLMDNRNNEALWSWWGNSSGFSFWMSAHVLRALKMAKDAGYTVNIDLSRTRQEYMHTHHYRKNSIRDIDLVHALSEWGTEQHYEKITDLLEQMVQRQEAYEDSIARKDKSKRWHSYLKEKLQLWEIRQKYDLGYVSDSVSKYLKKDVFGAVYCDDGMQRSWYSDNLATTLIAYRISKNDSALNHFKEAMQMYILGTKRSGWNTYQASSAVATVLPDLIAESSSKDSPATVLLDGKEEKELTRFPYEMELAPGEYLDIEKKDGMPLIFTAYSIKRVMEARPGDAFEVSTELNSENAITAGKPVTLSVKVNVKQKNAEHVMIEVPIPAGCSYASKSVNYYGGETHREHFKEKTVIFCESLPEGEYTFNIHLLPRYTGKYTLNPAKVEMMYFPVINTNNDIRKIEIEERE